MELQNISVAESAPSDVVQFVKHLEENLDPADDFDCDVWIETVEHDSVDDLPGEEIPTRGDSIEPSEFGVQLRVSFVENSNAPTSRFRDLTRSFYDGSGEYALYASFDGSAGEYEAFVFPRAD